MLLSILFPALYLMHSSTVYAGGSEKQKSCEHSKSTNGYFSSDKNRDTLTVKVSGEVCANSGLSIKITNDKGKLIYSYTTEMKTLTAVASQDPMLPKAFRMVVDDIVSEAFKTRTSSLPEWKPEKEFWDANYINVQLNQKDYEKYKKQNLALFVHPIAYDQRVELIFDPETKKIVTILKGGS